MDQKDYQVEIGRRLRAVRQQQDRTLDEVKTCSGGRLTGAAVGSWERADRSISAAKLLELADFYGVPADRLIPDPDRTSPVAAEPAAETRAHPVTVDLRVLPRDGRPGIDVVAGYVERIRQLRGDGSPAITLRGDDLQKLAGLIGVTVGQVLAGLDGQGPPDGGERPTQSRSEPHVVIDLDLDLDISLDVSTDRTSASEGRR